MRRSAIVLLFVGISSLLAASPALAGFGFEIAEWEGRPGEVIEVTGSDMLTCCPENTPTEAELVLEVDPDRPSTWLVLFEGVAASGSGDFATTFTVPDLPAGSYELNYCSRNPDSLTAGGGMRTCVPAERSFTILEPVSYSWIAVAGLVLVVVLMFFLWRRRNGSTRPAQVDSISPTGGDSPQVDGGVETLSVR